MSETWKNGSFLEKVVTLPKMRHKRRVIALGKMGRTKKNVLHLKNGLHLGNWDTHMENGPHFEK